MSPFSLFSICCVQALKMRTAAMSVVVWKPIIPAIEQIDDEGGVLVVLTMSLLSVVEHRHCDARNAANNPHKSCLHVSQSPSVIRYSAKDCSRHILAQ